MTFEEFLHREMAGLAKFAAALTGDRHLAEDVLSDALLATSLRWRRIAAMQHPLAYVRRTVVSTLLSEQRRTRRRRTHTTADLRLHAKRDRRRHRHQLVGVVAAITALSAATIGWRGGTDPRDAQTAQPPTNITADATVPPSAIPGIDRQFTAAGCAYDPLAKDLANARSVGASVITGRGALTGKTVNDDSGVRHEMTLSHVRTLAGPALRDGTTVWILASPRPSGSTVETDQGPLWGPDGALFGIYYPPPEFSSTTLLRQAPIVGDRVILSASGCWSPEDLPGEPFHGTLTEIPGTNAYRGAAAEPFGLTAVPLTAVERLARNAQN